MDPIHIALETWYVLYIFFFVYITVDCLPSGRQREVTHSQSLQQGWHDKRTVPAGALRGTTLVFLL